MQTQDQVKENALCLVRDPLTEACCQLSAGHDGAHWGHGPFRTWHLADEACSTTGSAYIEVAPIQDVVRALYGKSAPAVDNKFHEWLRNTIEAMSATHRTIKTNTTTCVNASRL